MRWLAMPPVNLLLNIVGTSNLIAKQVGTCTEKVHLHTTSTLYLKFQEILIYKNENKIAKLKGSSLALSNALSTSSHLN